MFPKLNLSIQWQQTPQQTLVLHLFLLQERDSYRDQGEKPAFQIQAPFAYRSPLSLGGAEFSHDTEKCALVGQIELMSALMQDRCSGEISHEREASGGVSEESMLRAVAGPHLLGVRTAGLYQSSDQHVDARRRLMWRFRR